jgi:D-alanine-D-alanine ligase
MKNRIKDLDSLQVRKKKKDLKIGVVSGGISSEREISLKTGTEIFKALTESGYNARFIDFKCDDFEEIKNSDVAFLALHGRFGEDGTIQGLLELLKIPYTGSGVLSSSLSMDKIYSKKIFEFEKIPTAPFIEVLSEKKVIIKKLIDETASRIGFPVIVKPSREGSTIGIKVIDTPEKLKDGLDFALQYDSRVLIEKFIKGRLITVSIIGDDPVALPMIEIRAKNDFYDYEAKYNSSTTQYLTPAPVDEQMRKYINEISLKCHDVLCCSGISRVDMILGQDNIPYVLELNTMPGMTKTSLVPKAAAAAGLSFNGLIEIILDTYSLKA